MLNLAEIHSSSLPTAIQIETRGQLREALERPRRLQITAEGSPREGERTELELSICRYLASLERVVR